MARAYQENSSSADKADEKLVFHADGTDRIDLPATDFVADAKMTREGDNLVLEAPDGQVAVIEGYFSADPAPVLHSPDGSVLTPNLVNAFVHSPAEFAANDTANDQSPVGAAEEVKGHATVTRADGTVETITNGTPIYQGDVVETDAQGAVNIVFIDETSMAISAGARLAIDQYTYDPSTESGTTNFSVLRGLFVFTSGLIGRDDPDDVKIDTPVGSIGIRGTIIAGEIHPGGESNISVLEGAIVIKNAMGEVTLSEQFETVRLLSFDQPMKEMGVLPASEIGSRFNSMSDVNPSLFTVINDAAKEQSHTPAPDAPHVDTAPTSSNDQPTTDQSANSTTTTETAPALPDVLAPIDSSVVSLNTSSSGLPSSNTVTGQPSTGLVDTTVTSSTTAPTAVAPTPTVTTTSTGTSAINGTTTSAPSIADTSQPPPSVIGSTGSGGTVTAPTVPAWATIDLATTNAASHHLIGDNIYNLFGFSISALGDYNKDGFDDFVVGNDSTTNNHSYVFNGSNAGIVDTMAGNTVLNQTDPTNYSSSIVAGIGDVNGDGMRDYIVGQAFNGTGSQGQVGVITATGLPLTYGHIVTIQGPSASSQYGADISGAGDYNNDGYADFVVGAPNNSGGTGSADLRMGGLSMPTQNIIGTGGASTDSYGHSVTGLSDFNGDGYSDLAVGAPGGNYVDIFFGHKNGGAAPGSVRLNGTGAFGDEVQSLGDVNGDGFTDLLVGGTNSGHIFFGAPTGTAGRLDFVSPPGSNITGGGAAGDFNGDGYDDFTLALDTTTGSQTYIVFGKSNIGSVILDDAYLNNYNNAIKVTYPSSTNATGSLEVSAIGDVDGDGYDDIAIGVYDANTAGVGDGGVFVVYGRDTGKTLVGSTATANGQSLVGDVSNNTLGDGGFNNIHMNGGAGNDTLAIGNTNFLGIEGGGGIDTLSVLTNLDFTNVNFEKMSGIERISFDGANNQTITLTMENLFNLLKSSDDGTLTIVARGSNNILNLDLNGSNGTNATNAEIATNLEVSNGLNVGDVATNTAGGYDTFKIGGYTLYIDTAVAQVNAI